MYNSNVTVFWKKQNFGDGKKMGGFQVFNGREGARDE